MPIMPRSPGITRIDRNGNTTRPSETAIMVLRIKAMHSAMGSNLRTSGPRNTRISISAGSQRTAQLLHCRDEGLDVIVIVIEMETRADVIVAVRSHDVVLHQFRRQARAVPRLHSHG